ncbi:FxSxx-COOH system tetratricopeptide repeat protein [Plantactinospora siamensis]|uniref:FxSxx-COOH system tetratricopeptide repeat protein n=1 Tax=Plantactinospora siamensis TaxID=555372 RepID=A0ABV6P3U7_9ACTN
MDRRRRRGTPPMDATALASAAALGLLLVGAAIAGQPVTIFNVEVALAGNTALRVVVGVAGALVLLGSGLLWWRRMVSAREGQVSNVPLRHPGFVGRRAELARLRAQLTAAGRRREPTLVVVQGPGGAGKTQLALEYAHTYRRRYDVLWWIPAERLPVVADRMSALAVRLGAVASAADRGAVAAAAAALRGFDRWLLIFDDPPDPAVLGALLPAGGAGHILVTTRDPAWTQRANAVSTLGGLARPDAVELVCARTGSRDRQLAADLAAEVGDLPLALEQGTAYLRSSGLALDSYLRLLRDRPRATLDRGSPGFYPRSLVAVHDLAVERMARDQPAALDLLRMSAFLAPDAIPLDLTVPTDISGPADPAGSSEPASVAADPADPPELRHGDAVAVLARAALVSVRPIPGQPDGSELAVHRLTQALVRDGLTATQRRHWCAVAVEALDRAFPASPHRSADWPRCRQLLPHVLEAVGHAARAGTPSGPRARLVERTTTYLRNMARLPEAAALLDEAGAALPDGADAAVLLRARARVRVDLGDLDRAVADLREALVIGIRAHGPRDPQVAANLHELATALVERGDLAEADARYRQALQLRVAAFGAADWRVAWTRRELGRVLRKQGALDAARDELTTALAADERSFGADHWGLAVIHHELGRVGLEALDLAAAERHLRRAAELLDGVHDNRWIRAWLRAELAQVGFAQGRRWAARRELRAALAELRDTLGDQDWRVADVRCELARAYRLSGRPRRGRRYAEAALATLEAGGGTGRVQFSEVLRELAAGDLRSGRPARARKLLERARDLDERMFGPGDWRVTLDRRGLAAADRALGRPTAGSPELGASPSERSGLDAVAAGPPGPAPVGPPGPDAPPGCPPPPRTAQLNFGPVEVPANAR